MITRFPAFLFAFALAFSLPTPTLAHQSRTGSASCLYILTTPEQRGADNGPLAPDFFRSPHLFYNDGEMRPQAFPFYASNEYDWHKTPWDDSPTDVLVGFGTNSAWDLASRKRAKLLMIADHAASPLIAQNFIFRPMLRLAETPAEFFALLAGVELPASHRHDSLKQIGEFIPRLQARLSVSGIAMNMQNVLQKMATQDVTQAELTAIAEYYHAMMTTSDAGHFGVLRSRGAHITGPLIQFYASRYLPQFRKLSGLSEVADPQEDSFLASQTAYTRFRELYTSSLYAQTDCFAADFYRALKSHGDERGYRRYTFSLSNIMDASTHDKAEAIAKLAELRRTIYEIFPRGEYDVVLFVTTNDQYPHGFLRFERDTPVSESEWLRTYRPRPE